MRLRILPVALMLLSSAASAATIEFGDQVVPVLQDAGVQSESGFTYEALSQGWEINWSSFSPGGPREYFLATFYNDQAAEPGDKLRIGHSLGYGFYLDEFDYRTISTWMNGVRFTGYLGGSVTGSMVIDDSSTDAWVNVAGAPLGLMDTLELEILSYGSATHIDNIQLTAVPVPAAVWLFGSALAGLGWVRKTQAV